MIGYSSIKVEFGFGNAPLLFPMTYTDVSADWQKITTTRGRSVQLDQYQPGTATIVLKNLGYTYDPDNAGGPYVGQLLPMTPVRVSALDSGSTRRNIFTGYVRPLNGWQVDYGADGKSSTSTVNCVDFFQVLSTINLLAVDPLVDTQKFAGQHSGTQIQSLVLAGLLPGDPDMWTGATGLDDAGFSNLPRGQALVQPYIGGANALQWVQNMALSEGGAFYVDRDGNANFDSRYAPIRSSRMTTSQATFDSVPGHVAYSALGKAYATVIYNSIIVTPAGQVTTTDSDATSIDAYTENDLTLSGLFLNDTSEAQARAAWYLAAFKDPTSCPAQLTVSPRRDNNALDGVLHRDLRDFVTVKFKPPSASAQVISECAVRSLSHSIDASSQAWTCTVGLEPLRYGFTDYTNYITYDGGFDTYNSTKVWGF